jgi:regulator of sigma E protease
LSILDEMVSTGQVPLVVQNIHGDEHSVVIQVGDDRTRLTEPGLLLDGLGFGVGQPLAIAEWIGPDSPAEQAGIQPGDRIVSVNNEMTTTFADMASVIVALPGRTVPLIVVRDGRRETLYVDIAAMETADGVVGRIGVGPRYLKQFGPVAAIGESISRTARESAFTVRMLWNMVTRTVSIKNISGPISIAQFVGDSARAGFSYVLTILSLISISLGVLNLLPVPMLDGGQIVYQTIEWIKGSPMSDRAQLLGQQVGIFAILLLMSFAFYNDIARLLD